MRRYLRRGGTVCYSDASEAALTVIVSLCVQRDRIVNRYCVSVCACNTHLTTSKEALSHYHRGCCAHGQRSRRPFGRVRLWAPTEPGAAFLRWTAGCCGSGEFHGQFILKNSNYYMLLRCYCTNLTRMRVAVHPTLPTGPHLLAIAPCRTWLAFLHLPQGI